MNEAVSMRGRVALVTGGNSGIGLEAARGLARLGCHVLIGCRAPERAQSAMDAIAAGGIDGKVEAIALDLADLSSVRAAATDFLARDLPLHLLVNNAGVGGQRGFTASGFELAFGVNHVGHFLLTRLLRGRIEQSAPARIVTVASRAHQMATGIDWDAVRKPTRSFTGWPEYSASKLANLLFSAELGRRLAGTGVTTYALHPGVVATNIWRRMPWPLRPLLLRTMIGPEEGAATTLHCATAPEVASESGLYYVRCRPALPGPTAQDKGLAQQLWLRSEAWVG